MQTPQSVVVPTVKHGFEESRRKLVEVFDELVFMRVAVVGFPKSDVRSGTHFQGEAIEVFSGRSHRAPRVAFFSRFGRQTGTGFNLLGITIVDTPLGPSHASAMPQVGDLIVGSLMPAAKGKLPFEIRGWSYGGKPLLELARIVQYGTRMAESELKRQLRQPCAETAASLLRLSSASLSPTEITHAKLAASCADELWVLVRIVCFGNLDDPGDARLGGKSFVDMVDMIATRFGDEVLLDSWAKIRPPTTMTPAAYAPACGASTPYVWTYPSSTPAYPSSTPAYPHNQPSGTPAYPHNQPSGTPVASPPASPPRVSANLASFLSKITQPREMYDPTTTPVQGTRLSHFSAMIPRTGAGGTISPPSPAYAPASPPYAPASPPTDVVSFDEI